MSREIKFSYIQQHDETGRITDSKLTLEQVEDLRCGITYKGYTLVARRQFTGLLDKHGWEIFEGDLLISASFHLFRDEDIKETPCVVTWWEERCGFALELRGRRIALSDYLTGWLPTVFVNFEVIGNIYENPELVEAPK